MNEFGRVLGGHTMKGYDVLWSIREVVLRKGYLG